MDAKDKWDEVGQRFSELGKHVKDRFDANVAFSDDEKAKVEDALHQIRDALDAGFTALGDSLRDNSMRDEVKQAGASIADALSSTFKGVAEELRKAVKRD
jgi:hypothetical protein